MILMRIQMQSDMLPIMNESIDRCTNSEQKTNQTKLKRLWDKQNKQTSEREGEVVSEVSGERCDDEVIAPNKNICI